MRVLVAGATGTLGNALVDALLARGHEVVALGRDWKKLEALRPRVWRVHAADVRRPGELEGACDACDAVVSAVGLVGGTALTARATHEEVDHRGNANLLAEAKRAGVGKFAYVSVARADEDDSVELLRAKRRMEDDLKASGLDWLVVRPTAFYEQVWEGLMVPARAGLVVLAGKGDAKVQPLDARDAAAWIAENLRKSGSVAPLGGPEPFTYQEMAELCFEVLGKKPRILHAPLGALALGAKLARPVPLALSGELDFLRFALTHDLTAPAVGKRELRDYLQERLGAR